MAGGADNSTSSGVPGQTGILEGANPTEYSASSPITLFIIQAGLVIIICQLLHYPLRLINQPRVIAEVIGGILLGPSVMMRIPGFQEAIFPTESMAVFNNVANLGLIIFMFLVALEVDMRMLTNNWRAALSVGLAGMILPFGLGMAIAWGLYREFHGDGNTVIISFGVYGLFIGTALAITAFPVLCRILTELKLLRTNVGITVLAAGIGNDVTGWILLALCVALVNNGSGLAALWALLSCTGWVLFLVYAVRPPFMWILRRTGSLQNGPTQGMVALTLLMVLFSAWFTNIIGIHAIFGAFLVGLICPHEGGFAIKVTEKIEDLISVLFLPLYFALSGLSTNLGLLNDGKTWAYVVGVIVCAFAGKIIGGTLAARANKLLWRESLTIGCLMSCKGLVELIVLNIGLQARILSQRTFTMFVIMALVTTVTTTPLTKWLYPPSYQQKVEKWRRGEIDWDGNPTTDPSSPSRKEGIETLNQANIRRLMVYLRLDSLPSLFTFITLLGPESNPKVIESKENMEEAVSEEDITAVASEQPNKQIAIKKRPLELHGLRIIPLTERTSSVMHVTEGEEFYSLRDPVVNAFRTFSQLHDVAVAGRVAIVPEDSYAETLMTHASDVSSDFALIPWSEYGSLTEDQSAAFAVDVNERFKTSAQLEFINQTLTRASKTCNAGIFIDNGFGGLRKPGLAENNKGMQLTRTRSGLSMRSYRETATLPVANKSHHVFFPFVGGVDDRVALRIVLQLAKNPHVTVSIVHVKQQSAATTAADEEHEEDKKESKESKAEAGGRGSVTSGEGEVVMEGGSRVGSSHTNKTNKDYILLATLNKLIPTDFAGRVVFSETIVSPGKTGQLLAETIVGLAQEIVGQTPGNAGDIVVVGRRHLQAAEAAAAAAGGVGTRTAGSSSAAISSASGGGSSGGGSSGGNLDLGKTVGGIAEKLVSKGIKASVLVIQAGGRGLDM